MRLSCRPVWCGRPTVGWPRRGPCWAVTVLAVCSAVGCLHLRPGHDREAAAPGSTANAGAPAIQLLGTVHVIGTGGRFVLVQASAAALVTGLVDEQPLVCRAAGNMTATLRVSRERRPPFVVADVVSGAPQLNDDVFIETPADHPTPAPTLLPAAPVTPPAPTPEFHVNPAAPSTR